MRVPLQKCQQPAPPPLERVPPSRLVASRTHAGGGGVPVRAEWALPRTHPPRSLRGATRREKLVVPSAQRHHPLDCLLPKKPLALPDTPSPAGLTGQETHAREISPRTMTTLGQGKRELKSPFPAPEIQSHLFSADKNTSFISTGFSPRNA